MRNSSQLVSRRTFGRLVEARLHELRNVRDATNNNVGTSELMKDANVEEHVSNVLFHALSEFNVDSDDSDVIENSEHNSDIIMNYSGSDDSKINYTDEPVQNNNNPGFRFLYTITYSN